MYGREDRIELCFEAAQGGLRGAVARGRRGEHEGRPAAPPVEGGEERPTGWRRGAQGVGRKGA